MVGAENMFPFQSEHCWKPSQEIWGYFVQCSGLCRTKFEVRKNVLWLEDSPLLNLAFIDTIYPSCQRETILYHLYSLNEAITRDS